MQNNAHNKSLNNSHAHKIQRIIVHLQTAPKYKEYRIQNSINFDVIGNSYQSEELKKYNRVLSKLNSKLYDSNF